MTDITFSVIINCKNSEKYLKEAVDSVLDQSYENFEIIIVDNNSKDSTSKIIKSLGDFRIKYFKLNNSLSLGEARNFGLKNSNGKFIGFLDSDDFWHCEKLEKSLIQFNNDQIAKFKSKNASILLGIDHKEYGHSTKLTEDNIRSLSADFI